MKIAKKVGRFELIQLHKNSYVIRVFNDSEIAPAAVSLYDVSGTNALGSALVVFNRLTEAWKAATR